MKSKSKKRSRESEEEHDDEYEEEDEDEQSENKAKIRVQSTGAQSRLVAQLREQDERRNRQFASEEGLICSELFNDLIASIDSAKIEKHMKLKKKNHPEDYKFLSDFIDHYNKVVSKSFFFFFFFFKYL